MKPTTLIPLLALALQTSALAEIRTITIDSQASTNSETLTIPADRCVTYKSSLVGAQSGYMQLVLNIRGLDYIYDLGQTANLENRLTFTGPATISLRSTGSSSRSYAFATFDVQPSAFPPDKALTVGAYSGNVKVTMEMSTDLVNWTAAVNGDTYTNSPDARFFRIRMDKNAMPVSQPAPQAAK